MSQPAGRISGFSLCISSVAFVLVALTTVPAFAAAKQAQERAARKACLGGDYSKGVNILADLFVDTKDPTYIFNQGRCFEQNHRYEDAISRFEEYLRVPDAKLNTADRAAADKHISDCKDRLPPDQSRSSQASSPQPFVPPPSAVPPESRSTAESPTPTVLQPGTHSASANSGSGLRVVGIIAASVGVAAVTAGVVFNLKSNSIVNQWETSVSYPKDQSTEKTYRNLAWAGYGVGAVCVVTGAILYGVGLKSGASSSTDVALLPAFGPGQAGAMLTGGF
jgi:hypothetical protein